MDRQSNLEIKFEKILTIENKKKKKKGREKLIFIYI
jgi:hypothetical protein